MEVCDSATEIGEPRPQSASAWHDPQPAEVEAVEPVATPAAALPWTSGYAEEITQAGTAAALARINEATQPNQPESFSAAASSEAIVHALEDVLTSSAQEPEFYAALPYLEAIAPVDEAIAESPVPAEAPFAEDYLKLRVELNPEIAAPEESAVAWLEGPAPSAELPPEPAEAAPIAPEPGYPVNPAAAAIEAAFATRTMDLRLPAVYASATMPPLPREIDDTPRAEVQSSAPVVVDETVAEQIVDHVLQRIRPELVEEVRRLLTRA
jgi:hypothetical protein